MDYSHNDALVLALRDCFRDLNDKKIKKILYYIRNDDNAIKNKYIYNSLKYNNILHEFVKNCVLRTYQQKYFISQSRNNLRTIDIKRSDINPNWNLVNISAKYDDEDYRYEKRMERYFKIINLFCSNFPWMIIDDCFDHAVSIGSYSILKILNKYYVGNEEMNKCFLCNSHSQRDLIKSPCDCNENVHIYCMINYTKQRIGRCHFCSKTFGENGKALRNNNDALSFPELNIYPNIDLDNLYLSENEIIQYIYGYIVIPDNDLFGQLTCACLNMVSFKVSQILKSMSNEDFKMFIQNADKRIFSITPEGHLRSNLCSLSNEINLLFLKKSLETETYNCDIESSISYGRYLRCRKCNYPKGERQRYKLSVSFLKKDNPSNNFNHCFMLTIDIDTNLKLFMEADFYDVYDNENLLYSEEFDKISNVKIIMVKLDKIQIETKPDIKIVFFKRMDYEYDEQEKRYITSYIEIYSTTIKIPEFKIYGNDVECNICMEKVDAVNDRYITPCGHLFHMGCIFKYFSAKNVLHAMNNECSCGGFKINDFNCAVCNSLIQE